MEIGKKVVNLWKYNDTPMSKKTTTGHKRRIHSAPHDHTTLRDWRLGRTPAPRRRRMSNYAINLAFLETYARESGYALSPRQLATMARRFTRWEVRNVFCHKNGYEDFRDQVICLDYDELLEMYVEETVHPAVRPPWQSPGNYAYFQSEVMGQMA